MSKRGFITWAPLTEYMDKIVYWEDNRDFLLYEEIFGEIQII